MRVPVHCIAFRATKRGGQGGCFMTFYRLTLGRLQSSLYTWGVAISGSPMIRIEEVQHWSRDVQELPVAPSPGLGPRIKLRI